MEQRTTLSNDEIESHVDQAVLSFTIDMKYKLRRNNHKGLWTELSIDELLKRLDGEVKELNDARIDAWGGAMTNAKLLSIVHECADVANYAMMIADLAKREMK